MKTIQLTDAAERALTTLLNTELRDMTLIPEAAEALNSIYVQVGVSTADHQSMQRRREQVADGTS